MSEANVVHTTFNIERTYRASPARLFAAFADQGVKRRWFAEGEGFVVDEFKVDFRVGGKETARFRFQGDIPMGNDTIFLDIVPGRRIVLSYVMTVADKRISVSLATVEVEPRGKGSMLRYTEQGAFFDEGDGPQMREEGCRSLLEKLAEELDGKA